MSHVHIVGDGIAALCATHLLRRAGLRVSIERAERRAVPAILLGSQALALIRDVFDQPALFADRPRIDRRIVRWHGGEAVVVPHDAVAVPEALLIERLEQTRVELTCPVWVERSSSPSTACKAGAQDELQLSAEVENEVEMRSEACLDGRISASLDAARHKRNVMRTTTSGSPDFTIRTTPGAQHRFGTRHGRAVQVRLRDPAAAGACRIEALARGWLFLVPGEDGGAWLLGVGAPLAELLAGSESIAPHVTVAEGSAPAFDTCPRLAETIVGADWLACGSAALGFDPICGDGAAQAVRAAMLAAAVIVAIAEGGDAAALLGHYEAMLIATMRRHLTLCLEQYRGGTGDWWRAEAEALRQGHAHCTARLATMPEPRFELCGFRLVAREAAA